MTTANTSTPRTATDPLALVDVDHVKFFVGNAKQAAFFYAYNFGFTISQRADLTTGSRERSRYLLTQGNIRLLLETPLSKDDPAAEELSLYGDGVKDIAFTVDDAEAAWKQAVKNGGESAYEPRTISDEHGSVTTAGIKTYGRVVHSFVSRTGAYAHKALREGALLAPGFSEVPDLAINQMNAESPCGLMFVDHCVGNVEENKMNHWVDWYENVMEFKMFKHFDDHDISTEHSSLMSKVMASGNNLIKMPINEPAEGLRKSQIQEYLEWHDMTPGVQHLALRTNDALHSVNALRQRGVDFLQIPDTYYETVWNRVEKTLLDHGQNPQEDYDRVKDLGIMVDADDEELPPAVHHAVAGPPDVVLRDHLSSRLQSFGKGTSRPCSSRWS